MRPVAGRGARHVVLGPAELEVTVPGRPGRPHVPVEGHPDAARIDEVGSVRAGPPELLVTVPEDHGPLADPGQHALVVVAGLGREALDVRQRRAVHVEDPVQLGLRRKRVEPLDDLLRKRAPEDVVGRHHLGTVERRLTQPALAVPADPGRLRQLLQAGERLVGPGTRRPVVAAEQPAIDAELLCLREHALQRRHVPVDVVEDSEHGG